MDSTHHDDERLRRTLRACRGQYCRPVHVSRDEEQAAIERGYLRFHEWPAGHYQVTERGQSFLAAGEEEYSLWGSIPGTRVKGSDE